MKDLNFEDELNFDEFPPVSTEKWEEIIQNDLKGKDYKESLRWDTRDGFDVLPFYRNEDLSNLDHSAKPLVTSANWSILEIVEDAKPTAANKQALIALENGASGLDIRLSSDRIGSKKDLETLFNGIRLDIITVVFGPSISSERVIKWVHEIISDRDLSPDSLDIHFSADIFSQAVVSGDLPTREWMEDSLNQMTSKSGSLMINTCPYSNAGANIIQQLAFALAAGNEYLGVSAEEGKSLSFRFSTGTHYFPEIAKYRAFRLLWTKVLEEYGVTNSDLNIFSETALWNKAQNDSHNNMLRTTTEAMSAALGGCNGITVHRFDEQFETPTPFASRIARNTQLILQEEAYLSKVSDPGAGSYYIEILTEKIAKESWKLFQDIESNGGFYEGLTAGAIQQLVSDSRNQKIQAYKEEKESLIGVNKYQPDDTIDISTDKIQELVSSLPDSVDITEITPIDPLYLEAELKKGDA